MVFTIVFFELFASNQTEFLKQLTVNSPSSGVLTTLHQRSKIYLRVGHPSIRTDSDEPVWNCDLVEVALLAVDDERVRNPDLGHEGPVQGQFSNA